MRPEQPVEVARAHAQALGKVRDAPFVQGTLVDQAKGPAHRRRRPVPGGRAGSGLGPAAQTRAEARRHGLFAVSVVSNVFASSPGRWADGPAVDARREDGDEEPPVEPRVAGEPRPVTDPRVQLHHGKSLPLVVSSGWPLSDVNVRAFRPPPGKDASKHGPEASLLPGRIQSPRRVAMKFRIGLPIGLTRLAAALALLAFGVACSDRAPTAPASTQEKDRNSSTATAGLPRRPVPRVIGPRGHSAPLPAGVWGRRPGTTRRNLRRRDHPPLLRSRCDRPAHRLRRRGPLLRAGMAGSRRRSGSDRRDPLPPARALRRASGRRDDDLRSSGGQHAARPGALHAGPREAEYPRTLPDPVGGSQRDGFRNPESM